MWGAVGAPVAGLRRQCRSEDGRDPANLTGALSGPSDRNSAAPRTSARTRSSSSRGPWRRAPDLASYGSRSARSVPSGCRVVPIRPKARGAILTLTFANGGRGIRTPKSLRTPVFKTGALAILPALPARKITGHATGRNEHAAPAIVEGYAPASHQFGWKAMSVLLRRTCFTFA